MTCCFPCLRNQAKHTKTKMPTLSITPMKKAILEKERLVSNYGKVY